MQLVSSEELWDLRQHTFFKNTSYFKQPASHRGPESLLAKKLTIPFPVLQITYPFPSCLSCHHLGAQNVFPAHSATGKSSVALIKFRNK